jgi:hypothetical protein
MTKVEVAMQERKTMGNAPLPSPASELGTFLLEIGTALIVFAAVISLFAAIFR